MSNKLFREKVMGNNDRKARLEALAARAGRTKATPPLDNEKQSSEAGDDHSNYDMAGEIQKKKSISFRNYAPTDKSLEQQTVSNSEDNFDATKKDHKQPLNKKRPRSEENQESDSVPHAPPPSSKSMLQNALREAQRETSIAVSTEPSTVANIAPKKINWDLKRDIQSKLAKLEKRTQKAVVDMLKKRLEMEAAQAAGDDDDDDDDLD
jgi:coiled-coil domain-containing protein 12